MRMSHHLQKLENKFSGLIDTADQAMAPLLDAIDINDISKHNADYLIKWGADKFGMFISGEKTRFLNAVDIITTQRKDGIVCDLGCLFPYLPLCLSLLGYRVKIVDRYDLYGPKFKDAISRLAEKYSIELCDLDILSGDFARLGQNDVVLLMAVIEHLNGTPRHLMKKIHQILAPNGFLILEVPNIAEFSKRIFALLGFSPLPNYEGYFRSEYPFMGHNREMTMSEVRYLLENTGFKVEFLHCYDYSKASGSLKNKLVRTVKAIVPAKNKGEVIVAQASLSEKGRS